MKSKKSIFIMFASMLIMVMCLTANEGYSNNKPRKSKDCCMMKDGKMMCMKAGKTMPMEMEMTMKNGTKVMTDGECVDKAGKKIMLKEGEMIDSDGMISMPGMKKMSKKEHSKMKSEKMTN